LTGEEDPNDLIQYTQKSHKGYSSNFISTVVDSYTAWQADSSLKNYSVHIGNQCGGRVIALEVEKSIQIGLEGEDVLHGTSDGKPQ